MKPAGLKTAELRNSTDHRSGPSLSIARGNSYQVWWAPNAFGLIWKKEETQALILEGNGSEDPAKPRISNRPLSVNSGTLLRRLSLARFRGAAGEGSRTGARKAPPVRRPQSGLGPCDPAKDPARCCGDPRPDPSHRDNLQPLRRYKLFGTPLREI